MKYCVNGLSVNGNIYKTEDDILHGWQEHFSNLATPSCDDDFDDQYRQQVHREMREIIDLCSKYGNPNDFEHITESQIQEAIGSLNKGNTPDYHGVQVEHLLYGGEELLKYLTLLVNSIFQLRRLTDVLKIGALTPIFKKKVFQ